MISVVLVMSVDVELEVAGPGPSVEPRNSFLDWEKLL